jgi:hypothetical protein
VYFSGDFGTLWPSAATQRAGVVGSVVHVAGAVRRLLWPCGTAGRVPSVLARPAERQSPQVDECDARAHQYPRSYEAFQHFITDAPWAAEHVWRRLRTTIPDREGVLILDGRSFPKQGTYSVGVARQYCGTLGKIALLALCSSS